MSLKDRINKWVEQGKEENGGDRENDLDVMVYDYGVDMVAQQFLTSEFAALSDRFEEVTATIFRMIYEDM